MRLGWCCVELHHGNVLETLSLLLLAVTKLRRSNPVTPHFKMANAEAKEYIRSLKPMNVTYAGH